MSLDKNVPRGYDEISDFINKLTRFKEVEWSQPITEEVNNFLEQNSDQKIIVKALLKKLQQHQQNNNKASIIAYVLSKCDPKISSPYIQEYIKKKESDDSLRRRLFLVLEKNKNHTDKDLEGLILSFSNKEHIAKLALKSLLDYVSVDGDNLDNVLKHLNNASTKFFQTLIANLTYRTEEQSIWLLGALSESLEKEVAQAAIKALGFKKSPLAYEILDNLVTHRDSKQELRLKSIEKLAQAGIHKANYRAFPPHKSYLSWIDGHGNRMLLVSRRVGKGRLSLVTFIIHEEHGFQDCSVWPDISNYELESMIKSWEQEVGLKQVDHVEGVRIIEDCLWTIVSNKEFLSPSFLSARRIFGYQRLDPRKYTIDSENLGIEHVKEKLSLLVKNSKTLLDEFPFSHWWLDLPACREFVKNRRSLTQNQKIRKDVLKQFMKTILEQKRSVFSRRFLLSAEFMHRISPRFYREQIETCLALYLALKDKMQLIDIPFIEGIATLTIRQVQKSFREHKNDS